MREFTLLIGQLFFMALIQMILEPIIDPAEKPHQARIINIAFIMGSFYLLMQFVVTHLLDEIMGILWL